MNHQAARRYSQQGRDSREFGVNKQQDFDASDIVPRRYIAPYDNRVRKAPYRGSRNLVWTSDGNRPKKNDEPYGSLNHPRKNNEAYGSLNHPRKNVVYGSKKNDYANGSMNSPVSGTGNRVTNQPRNNGAYNGPRSASVSGSRVWRSGVNNGSPKSKELVCKFWKDGNCKKGDQCQFLHSWSCFPGLVMVATLEGHKKDLKGIALPQGSDKLFSVSSDGALRIWDCHSGKCVQETNLQAEPGSLISEGSWVFLGLPNAVKAFNVQTCKESHLKGEVRGQVNAIAVGNGMIFAGTSSGSISVWKATEAETDSFEYMTSLEGHGGEVKCFIVGGNTLYSGSTDKTIKAWDLKTLQCTMTLKQHTNTVTSLLCWDQYLLSSSLDGTVVVWGFEEENGSLKVMHTRKQEESVHVLCGLHDAEAKPIMFCSYRNGSVGIYDLPSFEERGKMFSTHTMETITIGPDGLLFSGDKSGQVRVWSLNGGNNNNNKA